MNGSWFDATKWTPAAVPSVSDVACVDAAGTYTVTLDHVVDATPIGITALNIGAGSGTQTLRLAGAILTLNVAQGIEITPNGSLFFANFTGGTVSAASVTNDGLLKKTAQCGGCGTSDAINADIVNNGTIDVFGHLTWGKTNGAYVNTGAIVLSGSPGIDIPAGTGAPTFAQNSGSVSAPTLAVVFSAASYYQPQFFTVTAVDDAVVEGNHSGAVTHTATSTDASFNGAAIATLTANIADNDFAPNQPPNATDDAATTPEDQAKVVNVLANDSDPDGDALTVTAVTQPTNGTAAVSGGGQSVTYTPAANYHGGDSFTYTIDDGNAHPVSATVTMTVTPVNDNPVAIADVGATTAPNAVVVTVLANDSDVDGDVLSVASVTQPAAGTGTAAISGGGTTVTYTPPAAFSGTAAFTYTASDGNGGTASATVTVSVQPRRGPSADLAIAVQLGGDIAHPGFAVALLVTERNLGPDNSPSATITFAAVPGLQFTRAQGGTCTALANGDVSCARGSLSNGATRNTLVVRYRALSAGNYTLSGRISGVRRDPDTANDVASVSFARP